jgi:NAD(P)-dependent dehydrogenase (short-subunit alcohol dehydrogenase family)
MDRRTVIVTGGGQGIGRGVAEAFAAAGAAVVIADIDAEAGAETAAAITAAGGQAVFFETDVADEASVRDTVARVEAASGGPHVLINNAGLSEFGSLLTEDAVARWDRVVGTNLRGAFLCARYAVPGMRRAGGGAIVNIASTRAFQSEPDSEAYAASKGGLVALTHALAVSLGPDIRVNAISPGWIDVAAWQKQSRRRESDVTAADMAWHPAGRVGDPDDIAHMCLYLASDRARFVTGQNVVIDGGVSVRMRYE